LENVSFPNIIQIISHHNNNTKYVNSQHNTHEIQRFIRRNPQQYFSYFHIFSNNYCLFRAIQTKIRL